MKSHQRRLRVIELSLTPRQVVAVWLKNASQRTAQEAALHSPPYRGMVANAVYQNVQNSMKGHPESLVERAILRGRREADLDYLLVTDANLAVLDDWAGRDREYTLLLAYRGSRDTWISNERPNREHAPSVSDVHRARDPP
jgi:hypothetical protein